MPAQKECPSAEGEHTNATDRLNPKLSGHNNRDCEGRDKGAYYGH
jgi:hypothetical protein